MVRNIGAIAVVALLLAAGTAGAQALIDGSDIRDNSITGRDIKDKSLTKKDFRGSVRGPRGRQGPQGPQGTRGVQGPAGTPGAPGAAGQPGSAPAFAHVSSAGSVTAARSKNVSAANVTRPQTGVYCFRDLSFTPQNAVASPSFIVPKMRTLSVLVGQVSDCPSGTQVSVTSVTPGGATTSDTRSDSDFMIVFN